MDIIYMFNQQIHTETDKFPDYIIAIFFFTPIILGLFFFIRNKRFDKKWDSGIFPEKYKFNQDNLLEAYLCLAALIIQLKKTEKSKKILFINSYFNRYFKKSNYNFSDSLIYSFKHPIQINTVTHWLKKNIKDRIERIHVIYFLTGITMIDGKISLKEKKILILISMQLEININDLDRIILIYNSYKESIGKNKSKKISTPEKIMQSSRILGVKTDSSIEEIKKAYRKMVKLHHPDRFQKSGIEHIKIAEEKFIQIQNAYKIMTNSKC